MVGEIPSFVRSCTALEGQRCVGKLYACDQGSHAAKAIITESFGSWSLLVFDRSARGCGFSPWAVSRVAELAT